MKKITCFATALVVSLLGATSFAYAEDALEVAQPSQQWNFQVYLDKLPIGSHSFLKYGENEEYEMRIDADFVVKFLFFTAYTYKHSNREQWRQGCLQTIESQTDDNDDLFTVSGRRNADVFEVVANEQSKQLPGCITTFAYWDPRFLTQTALLNSQTGEYMPVEITGPTPGTRVVLGQSVDAQRYRIRNDTVDIKLWYSADGDWLALESTLESDRTLRYERK